MSNLVHERFALIYITIFRQIGNPPEPDVAACRQTAAFFGLFKRRRSTETPLRFQSRTGIFLLAKNFLTSLTV
jgi:hypothetical protein